MGMGVRRCLCKLFVRLSDVASYSSSFILKAKYYSTTKQVLTSWYGINTLDVWCFLHPSALFFILYTQLMNESWFREADWLKCQRRKQYQVEKVFIAFLRFLKCFSWYIMPKLLHHQNKAWQKCGRLSPKMGMLFYSSDCQKHLSKLISLNYFPSKFATWRELNSILSPCTFLGCRNLIHSKWSMGSVCRYCGTHHAASLGIRRDNVSVLSIFFCLIHIYCVPTMYSRAGQEKQGSQIKCKCSCIKKCDI